MQKKDLSGLFIHHVCFVSGFFVQNNTCLVLCLSCLWILIVLYSNSFVEISTTWLCSSSYLADVRTSDL